MIKKTQTTYFIILAALYCISYGLSLVNGGIFWDDWCLVDQDRQTLRKMFEMAGAPWVGDYHYLINQLPAPVFSYRLITFLAYFVSGLCLLQILRTISGLNDVQSLSIVGLFWLFPINSARITLICSPAAMCFLAFWLGYYFFVRGLVGKTKPIYLWLSLPLFWFSMWIASLMVFMALPAFHLMYVLLRNELPWSKRLKRYKPFTIVFILPIVFFIYKTKYFIPYELYEGYNKLTWTQIKESYKHFEPSFSSCFVGALDWSSEILKKVSFYVNLKSIFCFSFLLAIFSKNRFAISGILMASGVAIWILGAFPYNAIREITQTEWATRDQLLLGLGSALILVGIIDLVAQAMKIVSSRLVLPVQIMLTILLSAIFTKQNLKNESGFYIDWKKQQSIISAFKNSVEVKEGTLFVFLDDAKKLDAFSRKYRFYEYCGMLRKTFRGASRFGISIDDKTEADIISGGYLNDILKYQKYREYNFWEFQPINRYLRIKITASDTANQFAKNKIISCFKLVWLRILAPQEYGNVIRGLVDIKSY